MNLDNLIRELRIDWEDILSDDLDPLHRIRSLELDTSTKSADFRNIFHKVEKAMDAIVDNCYQSFSESISTYSKTYHHVQNTIQKIKDQLKFCASVINSNKTIDIDRKSIENDLWLRKICLNVNEIKSLISSVDTSIISRNANYASFLLQKINRVYCEFKLEKVKCLSGIFDLINNKRKTILDLLFFDVEFYICGDSSYAKDLEYEEMMDAIIKIGGLMEIDAFLDKNIERITSKQFKKILDEYKISENIKLSVFDLTHFIFRFYERLKILAAYGMQFSNEKLENFFDVPFEGEYKIFNKNFDKLLKTRVSNLFKKLIEMCCFPEFFMDLDEKFNVDDILDSVNYFELFDKKYSISYKMENDEYIDTDMSTKISVPFIPSVENMFLFLESIESFSESEFKDSIIVFIRKLISDKYFGVKNHKIERKIIYLLRDDSAFAFNKLTGNLYFFDQIDFDLIFSRRSYNDRNFFNFIFGLIERKMRIFAFKSFVKKHTVDIRADNNVPESLCSYFLSNSVDRNLFYDENKYSQIFAFIETLRKLISISNNNMKFKDLNSSTDYKNISTTSINSNLQDQDLNSDIDFTDLLNELSEILKIQMIYEIMYFLCRIYNDYKLFDECMFQISIIINLFSRYTTDLSYFSVLFDVINFYVQNNLENLNVFSVEDLNKFIECIITVDEILCELKERPETNLDVSIDMLKSLSAGNATGKVQERFLHKIGFNK